MIKSILVAVDGTKAARKAIDMASGIAKGSGATVHLLHVVKEQEVPEALREFAEAEHLTGPSVDVLHRVASFLLDDAMRQAEQAGAPSVTKEVLTGPVARSIVGYARDKGVDMIAIGTRGGTDLDELLLGGVSRRVSANAPCPCLLVK